MIRNNDKDLRPKVIAIAPTEGPPGTRISIRGENLGNSRDDLIGLTICGVNCLGRATWKTNKKLYTRTGRCEGLGEVIITTKSGGVGTCKVKFKALPHPIELRDASKVVSKEKNAKESTPFLAKKENITESSIISRKVSGSDGESLVTFGKDAGDLKITQIGAKSRISKGVTGEKYADKKVRIIRTDCEPSVSENFPEKNSFSDFKLFKCEKRGFFYRKTLELAAKRVGS